MTDRVEAVMGEREAEIRARVNAASPGPWYQGEAPGGQYSVWAGRWFHLIARTDVAEARAENAEFIAHAREDISWLLSVIADLRRELGK